MDMNNELLPRASIVLATTGIKWAHLAELDGPTYVESNNNQYLHFQNCCSFRNLLK